MVRVSVKAIGF